jgi:hypothetical protein
VVEVVFAGKGDATAWVRKHHITAEEARDHNTLVALMPSSMRRNIPMGDVLGAGDQWTIDGTADGEASADESGGAAKASAENESEDKTKSESEDGERMKAYGSGEVHVFKRPAVAGLAIPSAREQPASALRTSRDEKEKEKTGGSTIIRRGMAAMASPRTWLGKKDEKDGIRSFPLAFAFAFVLVIAVVVDSGLCVWACRAQECQRGARRAGRRSHTRPRTESDARGGGTRKRKRKKRKRRASRTARRRASGEAGASA